MNPDNIPNGGPAFPTDDAQQVGERTWHHEGMTLRDYFAAKAMQALIAGESQGEWEDEQAARSAYRMADAMLRARD